MSAALPAVHRPVVLVIFQIETVNRRPLTFEAVAHEDLGEDCKYCPPKLLL
jgi:hypothetical protein